MPAPAPSEAAPRPSPEPPAFQSPPRTEFPWTLRAVVKGPISVAVLQRGEERWYVQERGEIQGFRVERIEPDRILLRKGPERVVLEIGVEPLSSKAVEEKGGQPAATKG